MGTQLLVLKPVTGFLSEQPVIEIFKLYNTHLFIDDFDIQVIHPLIAT